jgi:flagellar basal body-associated protein FliL
MADDEGKAEGVQDVVPDMQAPAAPKGKSGTLVVIIVGFVIMITTPVITYFVVKMTVPPPLVTSQEQKITEKPGATTTHNLGTIFVNIAETKGTRVLKIEPWLVLSEGQLGDQLVEMEPMLRDKVLSAASVKTIDELEGPQGRENLKREIMNLINASIKDRMSGAVVDVYFNEFLIQ